MQAGGTSSAVRKATQPERLARPVVLLSSSFGVLHRQIQRLLLAHLAAPVPSRGQAGLVASPDPMECDSRLKLSF